METEKKATRLRDLAEKGGFDVLKFAPQNIEVDPTHNARIFDTPEMRERLDNLKRSIAAIGVQQPLSVRFESAETAEDGSTVTPARCVLIDGETRLRACLELIAEGFDIKTVPVIGITAHDEAKRIMISLTANTGHPLTQLELGSAFQKLIGYGWTPDEIASKVGYSTHFVKAALQVQDAPIAVKKLVAQKAITVGAAISEVKKSGSRATDILTKRVEEKKATGTIGPVKRVKTAPTPPSGSRAERQATAAAWVLRCFGDLEATSLPQRGIRHLEEAAETAHAAGVPLGMAHQMLDYVWERPKGILAQEIGGSGLTLLALAAAAGVDADSAEATELARVLSKPDQHFIARNAVKNEAGFLAVAEDEADKAVA